MSLKMLPTNYLFTNHKQLTNQQNEYVQTNDCY